MRPPNHVLFLVTMAVAGLIPGLAHSQTWTQNGPPARYYSSAVYDSSTDQMVVFGGQQGSPGPLNDVWSVLGIVAAGQTGTKTPENWVQRFPAGTLPVARYGHAGVYDSVSNRMIVFGGAASSTSCLNDTWVLDDANFANGISTWIQLGTSGSLPPARSNFNSAYDSSTNSLIVFGGANCASGYLSDVWVLSNANGEVGTPSWKQLSPSGVGPPARENGSAIYDSANNVLTIFGGDTGSSGFSDLWTLSHANGQGGNPTWTRMSPTGPAPSARTGQSAVYDSSNNRMIIFGGVTTLTGIQPLGDTWILTFANGVGGTPAWITEKVSGTAPQRRFHAAFYSSAFNDMVIFGGESQISPAAVDDRIFILTVANGL